MEKLNYKPEIYEGADPYIHISFHPNDREKILPILEKLNLRGFRFWINDGIAPGLETDEIIAEHIESCDFFVAFLSKNYLDFLDTVDELNYSRDVNKDYLLIYLEEVSLTSGLDMRFNRAQNVNASSLSSEDVYLQLLNLKDSNRFYGIADELLREKAKKVFDDLEKLYPEHKVFALDAVSKRVSSGISELYLKAGYPSAVRLMLDYGFSTVSTDEARKLRSNVLYPPGFEPDIVKPRIDHIMQTLSTDYPTKNITGVLSKTHKKIYSSLAGLSVWLGYQSIGDMLSAYGFTGVTSESGRIAIDHNAVINTLKARYQDKEKPTSVSRLIQSNPDLSGNIKTMSNNSTALFGMPFAGYLRSIGLLNTHEHIEHVSVASIKRAETIEYIKSLYEKEGRDYGEVEDTFSKIIVKRKNGNVIVTECSCCGETANVPYGVTSIQKEAFSGQSDLVKLILPSTVKEIGDFAFSDCTSLEEIVFSEGLCRIGNNAFSACTSLKSVTFPKTLTAIGNEAFFGCELLEDVKFENLRVNVQEDAFDECIYDLKDLCESDASPAEYFELKVERNNNAKIVAYTGDEEVVVVPSIILGHPIVSIEKGCFKDNGRIREVYISDRITSVGGDVFKDCKNLEKVYLSNSVKTLTSTVFSGCISLSEVNIPDSMEEVQRGLFKDSPLVTLYIGSGVKKISPDAFYKGIADFATGIYFKKKSLENVVVDTGNETFSAYGTMLLSKDEKVLIAELGDPTRAVVPGGVEEIGAQAFDRIGSLCEVSLPSTLKKIGEKAFAGTNLKSVELPYNLEVIESEAFAFCRSLTSLDINEKLLVIGAQAFSGCPIADVYIPASLESLGANSFIAISSISGQCPQRFRVDSANANIIADGIALYQKSADSLTLLKAYHPSLKFMPNEEPSLPVEYSIAEGTTAIAPQAFAMCNNLKSVTIPEGVVSIGDMAFWNCTKLSAVHLPESCTDVSPKAFFAITVDFV